MRAQVPVSAYRYEVGAGTVPRPGSWTDFKLKPGLDTVSGKWLSLQDFPESVPVQGESKGVEACAIGFDFPFAGQSMAYFGLTGDGLIYFFPEEEAPFVTGNCRISIFPMRFAPVRVSSGILMTMSVWLRTARRASGITKLKIPCISVLKTCLSEMGLRTGIFFSGDSEASVG